MNKRQAKKAFKKKYGINPNKTEVAFCELAEKIIAAAARALENMKQWAKEVNERIAEIGLEATKIELEEKLEKLTEEKEGLENGGKENI